jgi:hypothetical protein
LPAALQQYIVCYTTNYIVSHERDLITGAHLVHLVVFGIGGSDEHVVGDVVEVATVLKPGASHGDVVRGALALGLDEHLDAQDVLPVPGVEGIQQLQPIGLGVNIDLRTKPKLRQLRTATQ